MTTTKKIDPLYTIFEQHLLNFQDPNSDRSSFIVAIVKDYLIHMRKIGISVPNEWESQVSEELFFQVSAMLVKKIYGCLTINEYTAKASTDQKQKAKSTYRRLKKKAEQVELIIQATKKAA